MPTKNKNRRRKQKATAMTQSQAQAKQTRTRRKRNKRKVLNRAVGLSLTPGGKDFLRAVTDPFCDCNLRNVGVPDEDGSDTLKILQYQSITAMPDSSGNIQFTVVPCPAGSLIPINGKFNVELFDATGVTMRAVTFDPVTFRASAGDAAVGVVPYPDWDPSGGYLTQNQYCGPYGVIEYRTVAIGVEVRYKGTTLNDSGIIYVARQPIYAKDTVIPSTNAATNLNVFGPVNYWRQVDVGTYGMASNSQLISNIKGFTTLTLKQGLMAISTNENADWKYQSYNSASLLTQEPATADTNATAFSNTTVVGMIGYDSTGTPQYGLSQIPVWSNNNMILVSIEGMQTGDNAQSVEIRIRHYMEYKLQPGSPWQKVVTPSPTFDSVALAMGATVQKQIPSGMPVNMNAFGDWWKKVMGFISKVAGSVGRIVGLAAPQVGLAAGGISVAADALSSLADL